MGHRKKVSLLAFAVSAVAAALLVPTALAWDVDVTAKPRLKRTHTWTIEKSVDKNAVTLKEGETADLTYSVTVKNTGSTDSDWGVDGTVTMSTDPLINIAWLTVTIESPAPAADIPAAVNCLPYTFPVSLGVSGLQCGYSAALPDASGPRNAWMRAQQVNGNFRNERAQFDFSTATVNSVDECVAVTDTMAGSLGNVCVGGAPKTFTYTKTVGPYNTCGSYLVTNNASYVTNNSGATGNSSTATAVTVTCKPPVAGSCHETVNPAGNPAVGDNGYPDDPFGGDAVPGGKHTSPGTKGNGPINSDGFYLVGGLLFSDKTPIAYPGGGFVWPANTTIKYTERGNPSIKISSQIGGPKSVIEYHVQAPGDLYVNAPMGAAGAIFCGVPPPPF